ncbi:MAG TPA: type II secretion system F family protein [Nocardioidaceae bacterium]|nr:type II secretion system F family protein [Nocardioidaceae bacterium]
MSLVAVGALVGAGVGTGLVLVLGRLTALRRPSLELRVLPYVRDLPRTAASPDLPVESRGAAVPALFGPVLSGGAAALERVLGGSESVRRRLQRADLPMTVHQFRIEQVLSGLAFFSAAAAVAVLVALREPGRTGPLLVMCGVAFVLGVLTRDNRLTAQVSARERRILTEFPTIAELLALAVAAGEGPSAALARVVSRSRGELSVELGRVLAEVRTGTSIVRALDALAGRTGLPVVARFAEAMAVALERGTPLADVLHAQAADVREAARRDLIESGARKEVLMMVPVVFLVLPVTVLFAFWPGVVGLRLVTP